MSDELIKHLGVFGLAIFALAAAAAFVLKVVVTKVADLGSERIRLDFQRDLEHFRAQVGLEASISQTRITRIDERRFDLLLDMYAELDRALVAANEFMNHFQILPLDPEEQRKHRRSQEEKVVEALNRAIKLIREHAVLLPKDVATDAENLHRGVRTAFVEFRIWVEDNKEPGSVEAFKERSEKWRETFNRVSIDAPKLQTKLQDAIRALLDPPTVVQRTTAKSEGD